MTNPEALVIAAKRHLDPLTSVLYGRPKDLVFVCVLNDHDQTGQVPGWGDHRVILKLEHSIEWKRWAAHNGSKLAQEAFAELVEDGLADIVDPPSAELYEIARSFEATRNAHFKSSIRLQNGETQLSYEENVKTGKVTIPESFSLRLRPFNGSEPVQVTARLRYRIPHGGGSLQLWYQLVGVEEILRAEFNRIAESVLVAGLSVDYIEGWRE